MAGFTEAHRRIALSVGSAFEIPFVLTVEGIEANVTVTPRRRCSNRRAARSPTTVAVAEVESLPLNGRNFLDVALLAPSVAPPNINSTQLFAETSAVPGVGLSVGSQRNLSNSFIVDGLSANDDAAGLSGMPYGVDAVEQFQVVTSGGQAELGRALGGYVNVVTRSGTNQLRGTAYGFFRDDALNSANALSGTTLPMSQKQYGGSVGGPIRRGRTFYFVNAEQRLLDQTGFTTISDANVAIVNARLAAVGYPGQTITTGNYPNPVDSLNLLGKVDHAFTGRDQLSRPLQPLRRRLRQLARRRRPERAVGIVVARQPRPGGVGQQHPDHRRAHRQRDPGAVHLQRPAGAADRPGRPDRQHRRGGHLRHLRLEPAGPAQQDVPGRRHDRPAARRARAAGRRRPGLQRRHHHLPADGAAAPTRSRRWPTSWPAPTTTPGSARPSATRGAAGQHQPRALRPGRVERDAAADPQPRAALRPAVPRDRRHRRQQPVAAGRLRLDAVRGARPGRPRQRRPVLRPGAAAGPGQRAAVGGQHHRSGAAAAAEHRADAGAGRCAGVPGHPAGAGAVGDALQPDHDAARPAERLVAPGQPRGRAATSAPSAPPASATPTCAATGC